MEKAFLKLIGNIHGTDAALLAICCFMYFIVTTRKISTDLAIQGMNCMLYLGLTIVIGRVLLALISRVKQK